MVPFSVLLHAAPNPRSGSLSLSVLITVAVPEASIFSLISALPSRPCVRALLGKLFSKRREISGGSGLRLSDANASVDGPLPEATVVPFPVPFWLPLWLLAGPFASVPSRAGMAGPSPELAKSKSPKSRGSSASGGDVSGSFEALFVGARGELLGLGCVAVSGRLVFALGGAEASSATGDGSATRGAASKLNSMASGA